MMYERIAPDEPTSAPTMISRLFCRVKPMPAAAPPATGAATGGAR